MVVLGGVAVSYERGTPVVVNPTEAGLVRRERPSHTAGYPGIFWPELSDFPLHYPLEPQYAPTLLPTAVSMDDPPMRFSRNPCVVRCMGRALGGSGFWYWRYPVEWRVRTHPQCEDRFPEAVLGQA